MPSVPQHRSSSLEIWGRGEAKSFLLESRAGSIISRWQARARNLACLKLTQSHSFQKLEMPRTKSAWGSSTSLRIWRQLPSSSDHHPISLSPPIQILSWNIGQRKNELQGMFSKLSTQIPAKKYSIFCMKHQINNASASKCLIALLKAVSLAGKLTMNVGTDLELQIPVG